MSNPFTAKSINKEWVKNKSFEEFKAAYKDLGYSEDILIDAYAQVKSIIAPNDEIPIILQDKNEEDGISDGINEEVPKPQRNRNSRRNANKQSEGDSAAAEGADE